MALVTCGLTAEDRDRLWNPTLVSSVGLLFINGNKTGCIVWDYFFNNGNKTGYIYRRFGDLVAVACLQDGSDKRLDSSDLTDHHLVVVVVARQVRQDAGRTRHHVDVLRRQQVHHGL